MTTTTSIPWARLGEHQPFGALLGALIGGALRIIGDRILRHRAFRLGMEDVEGGGVDRASDAGIASRGDHVAGPVGVHPLEDVRVREPLLEQAHAVEHPLGAIDGAAQRSPGR